MIAVFPVAIAAELVLVLQIFEAYGGCCPPTARLWWFVLDASLAIDSNFLCNFGCDVLTLLFICC